MTSQYGQKFICTLPAPPKKKEEKEGSHEQENLPPNTIAKIVSAGFYTKKCTNRVSFAFVNFAIWFLKFLDLKLFPYRLKFLQN